MGLCGLTAGLGRVGPLLSGWWFTLEAAGRLGLGLFGGSLVMGLGLRLALGLPCGLGQMLISGLGTGQCLGLGLGLGQVLGKGLGLGQ